MDLQGLSNLVWELRFLSIAAQTAHWRVFGPSSYSDHLLFGRVYEKLDELLDPIAERLTSMAQDSDEIFIDPVDQARYVYDRMTKVAPVLRSALLDANALSTFFYQYLKCLSGGFRSLSEMFDEEGILTSGLDDLLASTANEIETLVFFLERRSWMSLPTGHPPISESPILESPVSVLPL